MAVLKYLTLLVGAVLPIYGLPVVDRRGSQIVPNSYIVTLKSGIAVSDIDTHLTWVSDVHSRSLSRRDTTGVDKLYNINDFHGYSGSFDAATIQEIRSDDKVSSAPPSRRMNGPAHS